MIKPCHNLSWSGSPRTYPIGDTTARACLNHQNVEIYRQIIKSIRVSSAQSVAYITILLYKNNQHSKRTLLFTKIWWEYNVFSVMPINVLPTLTLWPVRSLPGTVPWAVVPYTPGLYSVVWTWYEREAGRGTWTALVWCQGHVYQ